MCTVCVIVIDEVNCPNYKDFILCMFIGCSGTDGSPNTVCLGGELVKLQQCVTDLFVSLYLGGAFSGGTFSGGALSLTLRVTISLIRN